MSDTPPNTVAEAYDTAFGRVEHVPNYVGHWTGEAWRSRNRHHPNTVQVHGSELEAVRHLEQVEEIFTKAR